jgi:Rps23 Pro-64 3,4-dihydroxylase Tpa1-like proline 4-hydroxylase
MGASDEPLLIDSALLGQAEQRCRQRLAADPENGAAMRSLAELCRKQGNLEEAAALYGRLYERDPKDEDAAYLHSVLAGTTSPISPTGTRPSPFMLLKNFLPQDFHDALIPFADATREKFVPSRVGKNAEYKPDVRQTLELNEAWQDGDRFAGYLRRIPDLFSRLQFAPFPGVISAIRMRAYADSHFFKAHIDTQPGTSIANRVYNFVYFFHRVPKPYTGGELLLFDTDPEAMTFVSSRFTRVIPEDNAIILFPCAFYHSVLPVKCSTREFTDSRFVINGHVSRVADAGSGADQPDDVSAAESS